MSNAPSSATQRQASEGQPDRGSPSAGPPRAVNLPQVEMTYVEGAALDEGGEGYRLRHAGLQGAGRWVRFARAGGMGAVVEVAGEDRGDGSGLDAGERRFALKMVKDTLLGRSAVVDRFRRELRSHRKLTVDLMATRLVPCLAILEGVGRAPGAVEGEGLDEAAVGEVGGSDGELFGLFPFYPEGSLESLLEHGIGKAEALFVVVDAVEGLQSLHGHRYVHRDFHPSNILVEREGGRRRGMLGDLGVGMFCEANTIFTAERVEEDRGHRVGHPGYIDPSVRASPQADLYAVGATVFRIFTGTVPPSAPQGPMRLPAAVEVSPPLRQLADQVLAGLTSPVVEERFASAREARSAVVRLAEQLPVATSPTVVASRASTADASSVLRPRPVVSRPREEMPPSPGGRRWRRLAAVPLAALVFATVGFGGWRWLGPGGGQSVSEGAAMDRRADFSEGLREEPAAGSELSAVEPPPEQQPPVQQPPEQQTSVLQPSAPQPGATTGPAQSTPRNEPSNRLPPVVPAERAPSSVTVPPPTFRRPPPPPKPAQALPAGLAEVDKALAAGRFDRAQRLLEDLRTEYPADPDVASRLASLFLRDREVGPGMARRVLTVALEAHPRRGDLRHFLARVLHQIGQDGDALQLLREAPADSSFAGEIADFRVTLEKAADPH